jgi:hypothetical protein
LFGAGRPAGRRFYDPPYQGLICSAPIRDVPGKLVRLGDLGQMGAGRTGLLARPAPLGPLGSPPLRPRGLAGPSEDGGRCEFEESLPSRRFNSTTALAVWRSAGPARRWTHNSAMTAA